jgi:hypothetical protein
MHIINDKSAKNDTQTIEYDLWISHNIGEFDMVIVLPTTVFNIPYFISGSNTRAEKDELFMHSDVTTENN